MPPAEARPAGLVLAAGAGRRLGRPKALVEFHDEPLVRRAVRLLRRGGCAAVSVVVGAAGPQVAAVLADLDVEVVHNADWSTGMGGSLRAGITAVRAHGCPAVVVALVDQPLIGPVAVQRLTAAWRHGAVVAVATYDGHPRNPVLFDAAAWNEVDRWADGDQGARGLLRARPEWVQAVPCDAVASPRDIDTIDDLRVLQTAADPNPVGSDDVEASKEQTMELNHSFTVPVGVEKAFEVLTDIERIAPCMPGAAIESVDGDDFTGKVKVKVGPMQVTYRGKATYAELDRDNHSAVIEARAQETRGSGTANATITADLTEKSDDETEVTVVSNLSITGRPAQFGRGVMNEVGAKLLNQFADCLASRLAGDDETEDAETDDAETDGDGDGDDASGQDETADADQPAATGAGSNGSSAASAEQEITQEVGAAPPQPAGAASGAAAAAAPSPAAATSGATPADTNITETPETRTTTPRQTAEQDVEAIDLFEVAGASVAKRVIPAAAVALLLILLIWRRRRS